jgi:hypothetical protein
MKSRYLFPLLVSAFVLFFALNSCTVVKWTAGADIDSLQFAKSREAKMLDNRYKSTSKLLARLKSGEPTENADISFYLSPGLMKRILSQYNGSTGWLDGVTSYKILSLDLKLNYGSANVALNLDAHNDTYNVNVKLTMDCLLYLETANNQLFIRIEPYNISPAVNAGGLLGATEEIIANLIKINMADIGKQMPPLQVPVDFTNNIILPANNIIVKDKLNMSIQNPKTVINFKLKLKEVIIFNNAVFVAMNFDNMEVAK